jgi:hypothetical protein
LDTNPFQLRSVGGYLERNPQAPSLINATTGLWSGEEKERSVGMWPSSPGQLSLTTSSAGIGAYRDLLSRLGGKFVPLHSVRRAPRVAFLRKYVTVLLV